MHDQYHFLDLSPTKRSRIIPIWSLSERQFDCDFNFIVLLEKTFLKHLNFEVNPPFFCNVSSWCINDRQFLFMYLFILFYFIMGHCFPERRLKIFSCLMIDFIFFKLFFKSFIILHFMFFTLSRVSNWFSAMLNSHQNFKNSIWK